MHVSLDQYLNLCPDTSGNLAQETRKDAISPKMLIAME